MSTMTAQQRAELLALIGDAKPATDDLLFSVADQIRDRREHDHDTAGPDWDWYCLNASGWLGDKVPTVLRRLLDAEAEVERLRQVLSEATDQVAALDSEIGGWSAKAAALEAQARNARDDRDMEIVRWLCKKAREYRSTGNRQHAFQADAIELVASKITAGAVRLGGA